MDELFVVGGFGTTSAILYVFVNAICVVVFGTHRFYVCGWGPKPQLFVVVVVVCCGQMQPLFLWWWFGPNHHDFVW